MSATVESPVVGFVGLGNQGGPIAARIVGAGFALRIWARRSAALDDFAGTPAVAMASRTTLAAACDIVGVCVVNDADVIDVCVSESGLLHAMRPGSVLLIHSTVAPETCAIVARAGAERGVHVLDAPVSGGHDRATRGEMAVLVGGDREVFEQCRPVFATFATSIEHLGPIGSGQRAKLVNNAVFTVNLSVVSDAIDVGVALGIDRDALTRVLLGSSAKSFALESAAAAGISTMSRAATLLRKDVDLFAAMLPDGHVPGLAATTALDAVRWLEDRQATAD